MILTDSPSRMSTEEIKNTLTFMDKKPNGTWTHKDLIIEMHLVSELLNRWEDEWVAFHNGETE
mgnify:CR=1 FL=1